MFYNVCHFRPLYYMAANNESFAPHNFFQVLQTLFEKDFEKQHQQQQSALPQQQHQQQPQMQQTRGYSTTATNKDTDAAKTKGPVSTYSQLPEVYLRTESTLLYLNETTHLPFLIHYHTYTTFRLLQLPLAICKLNKHTDTCFIQSHKTTFRRTPIFLAN